MKRAIAAIAAALALAGCMSPAPETASRDVVIRTDWGGNVWEYRQEVGALIFDNRQVRVRDVCASACTAYLVLGPDRVCTSPTARWGFHSVTRGGQITQDGTERLVDHYPARLQAWFWANAHGKKGRDFAYLSGAQMIANGWAGEC